MCVVLDEDSEEYIELVNPEIVAQSGEQTGWRAASACPANGASSPGRTWSGSGPRTGMVTGSRWRRGPDGRAFCHEIEHLDGHLFVEHIDTLSDEELRDYLEQEEREAREAAEAQEGE